MYYRKKAYPKKVKQRIMRHKRTRYHNDAAFFHEGDYSTDRKRTKAKLRLQKEADKDELFELE